MATLKPLFGGFAALSLLAGGIGLISLSANSTAYAQTSTAKATVDAAIKRGEVGEQINGYLGIVDGKSPSPAVRNAVSEINIARKAVYTQAASGGVEPPAVYAQLTGEKQIKKAAPGTYVKDASGVWKKK
jgi:uncharacterized protein YdbL (DUF1318 family)